jgi:hypothetical protein
MTARRPWALFLLVASSACAARGSAPVGAEAEPHGACVGAVEVVEGLHEVSDPALVQQALGAPGKGQLCEAKAFEVTRPLPVFRVWDASKPPTRLGRWWSFARPAGPREAYRAANEICAEWSALDVATECHLSVGAHVVLGPGQSATRAGGAYTASPTNQLFVPNDTRDPAHPKVFVGDCGSDAPWP